VEKQVMVVHGSGFCRTLPSPHIRIVFLPDEATLERAYRGIADFMREHYP